jgi:cardiolipin synthase
VAIGFVIQIAFYVLVLLFFGEHFPIIDFFYRIVGILIVLYIIRTNRNLNLMMPVIVLILVFPILGAVTFVACGQTLFRSKTLHSIASNEFDARRYYLQDHQVKEEVEKIDMTQMRYLYDKNRFPVYDHNHIEYYPLGDEAFPVMIEELKKAKHFMFLEYFIIHEGKLWNTILEILKKKVKQGVEVRVMYDDIGCISTLNKKYPKELESYGIKCVVFNHLNPVAGLIMNNRDHRKILVIDGLTGFTGGMNLADEYINVNSPYGHWKDNGIMVKGSAVWSMTLFFLTSWNAFRHEDPRFEKYKVDPQEYSDKGYVIPYCDSPLDQEDVGENVYISILAQAKDYVYIMTPYLIIDESMQKALVLAAERGVDVRMIIPGVPDKKMVYQMTLSYCERLIDSGVKIYKYTPGFVHAKVFVCDDRLATVGTINMDYRSLVHHFECGLFMCDTKTVQAVKKDALDTISRSQLMTSEELKGGVGKSVYWSLLRVAAPLF